MSNILIINAHHYYSFSKGELNAALAAKAVEVLESRGHATRLVVVDEPWDANEQVQNHLWADVILVQTPVNWMDVPWTFKKYMDDVYTAGMGGELCNGDGRSSKAPALGYGTGGSLHGKKYMLSLTFNAPKQAFNNPREYLFQGKSVDDLFFPLHMNFRFFAMEGMETFVCYDVMKNPTTESDLVRFVAHLEQNFEPCLT